jgi:hypothetical protein
MIVLTHYVGESRHMLLHYHQNGWEHTSMWPLNEGVWTNKNELGRGAIIMQPNLVHAIVWLGYPWSTQFRHHAWNLFSEFWFYSNHIFMLLQFHLPEKTCLWPKTPCPSDNWLSMRTKQSGSNQRVSHVGVETYWTPFEARFNGQQELLLSCAPGMGSECWRYYPQCYGSAIPNRRFRFYVSKLQDI